MNISFRALKDADITLLFQWLQRPHVKEWWDDGDDTIEKVKAQYFDSTETVYRHILLSKENDSIGYFQCYPLAEGVIGIDQFIGDERFINQGIGTKAVKMFAAFIFEKYNPNSIILDPDPNNSRAIRCYEKAGFKFHNMQKAENGKQAYIMKMMANT